MDASVTTDLGYGAKSMRLLSSSGDVKRQLERERSEQPVLSERDEIKWLVTRELIMKIKHEFDDPARD